MGLFVAERLQKCVGVIDAEAGRSGSHCRGLGSYDHVAIAAYVGPCPHRRGVIRWLEGGVYLLHQIVLLGCTAFML